MAPRLGQTLALGWERKNPSLAGTPGQMNKPASRVPVISQAHLSPKNSGDWEVDHDQAEYPGWTPVQRKNSPGCFRLLPARLPAINAHSCERAYIKPTLGIKYVEREGTAVRREDSDWCPHGCRYQTLTSFDFLRLFQESSNDRT